jgi:hypothetical protein
MTGSLANTALILSLVVYVCIISREATKASREAAASAEDTKDADTTDTTDAVQTGQITKLDTPLAAPYGPAALHGQEYAHHYTYTDAGQVGQVYNAHVDIPHGTTIGVDEATVELARRRQRDRQALEGQLSKDVNYYRYHFAGELDESERRHGWWGHHEY